MKLLIVDDEKIIRETISNHIPWKQLGIDYVHTAANGLEAYDYIMDEFPDIVMTDIKMPGLSGLELIQKIKAIHSDVEFIILTGYGEFEYAREAMQYGIQYYLLKPCNEDEIIDCVKKTVGDISQKSLSRTLSPSDILHRYIKSTVILNIINDGLVHEHFDFYDSYKKFMDFYNTPYELCYFYFLDEASLDEAIQKIKLFRDSQAPGINFEIIYVRQTMILFFPSYYLPYENLDYFFSGLSFAQQKISIQYKRIHYENLKKLLDDVITKVRRYETICFNTNNSLVTICNYPMIMHEIERLSISIYVSDMTIANKALEELFIQLYQVTNPIFLKQLISSIVMKASSHCLQFSCLEATEFLFSINPLLNSVQIMDKFVPLLQNIFKKYHSSLTTSGTVSATIDHYVRQNLSDSNLSLKWIAENVLYMDVDYVSKKFSKETGQKFSAYLTDLRIKKAKELLMKMDNEKIQTIAESIGCGNNPQYFSQLFKKATGMTPSAYIKYISGGK